MPLFQETLGNLFDVVNYFTIRDKKKKISLHRICALIVIAASERTKILTGRSGIWSKYEKDLKDTIEEIKNQLPRKPDLNEFEELRHEATLAYQAINAINKMGETEGNNI